MIVLTLVHLRAILEQVLAGRAELAELRDYVFLVHDGENVEVEVALQRLLPALEPYFLYEEAHGDPTARVRLRRLAEVLALDEVSLEHVIFALEFDGAVAAVGKHVRGVISDSTLTSLLAKLSPVEFDVGKVERWARAHRDRDALDEQLLA